MKLNPRMGSWGLNYSGTSIVDTPNEGDVSIKDNSSVQV